MTDASPADITSELRRRRIDCETVHKLMRGRERSQERISDGEIAQFLRDSHGEITLIVTDHDLPNTANTANYLIFVSKMQLETQLCLYPPA